MLFQQTARIVLKPDGTANARARSLFYCSIHEHVICGARIFDHCVCVSYPCPSIFVRGPSEWTHRTPTGQTYDNLFDFYTLCMAIIVRHGPCPEQCYTPP